MNELYQDDNKSGGFKMRGFVNSINTILSPIISGFLIYYFDTLTILSLCLGLSAVSFLLFYHINLSHPKTAQVHSQSHTNTNTLSILLFNPIERLMVAISALANFIITPLIAYVIPYQIAHTFKLSAFYIGIGEGAFGLGMIIGSVFLIKILNQKIGNHRTTSASVFFVAFGVWLGTSEHFMVFLLALMMIGMGVVMFNINSTHIRSTATPKDIRQSFEFIFLAVCIVFVPLGVLLTTWVIDGGYLTAFYGAISGVLVILTFTILYHQAIKNIYTIDDKKLDGYYQVIYQKIYEPNPSQSLPL
ncbi:MFS transporter [Moraxella nasovis]|uniref:MFS transporter n=1 Tax=Moraxella nasovis TaxID=2904121 RepID=UPI001F609C9D|nr:MFS transporter [Moraxella nasovis]UNU72843.1 MFS transporter [Moraxella nasovis]